MLKTQNLKPFQIQRTCVYDGPGFRSTIFFKGCKLRCIWCQNPEMQSFKDDILPESNYSIDDIVEIVSRDKDYFFSSDGGVTLSGGEPLLQNPDSLKDLLKLFKDNKIEYNIKVDHYKCLNCGHVSTSKIKCMYCGGQEMEKVS